MIWGSQGVLLKPTDMGKFNVRCLLFSTAPEFSNHSVLLRDHLLAWLVNQQNVYNDMSFKVDRNFIEFPSQNPFFFPVLLNYSGFLKCEKKTHIAKCLQVLNYVTQSLTHHR